MKKKGVTLIETVIVMALVFLILGVVDSILISYLKNYKSSVTQNKGFNYLNEAIAIVEKEVNQNVSVVKTEGNIIKITYADGVTLNHIKCIDSNLYILYGTKYNIPRDSSYKSIILDHVKEFVAMKSEKVLYIKVLWHNGQSIERCLAIENAN